MQLNNKKVILYRIPLSKEDIVERVVFTEHVDWKLIYDRIGDKTSVTEVDANDYEKDDLITAYRKNGFRSFRELNPLKTMWEEYYITKDNELKEYMLKWKRKNTPKKKILKGVKSYRQSAKAEAVK